MCRKARLRLKLLAAAALALGLGMTVPGQAAGLPQPPDADGDVMNRLIRAAFFSDACAQAADALGIAPSSGADALLAAFAAARAQRAGGFDDAPGDARDCAEPAVLLVNLLRRNGVDAELVLATMGAATADGPPSRPIDRVIVYVPATGRYAHPAAPPGRQAALDAIIRESAWRMHLLGPSASGDAGSACATTCMHVHAPVGASAVRVKTETIRGR